VREVGYGLSLLGSLSMPITLPEEVQVDLRARGHVVTASARACQNPRTMGRICS
jgi:hypothetical protein